MVPITLHKQRCHAVGTRAYDIPGLHSCQGHGDITAFHGGNFLGHLSEAGCYRVMPTGCNKTMHETLLDISSLKSTVNHRGGQHKCGGVCGCLMTNRTKPKPFRSTHRANPGLQNHGLPLRQCVLLRHCAANSSQSHSRCCSGSGVQTWCVQGNWVAHRCVLSETSENLWS